MSDAASAQPARPVESARVLEYAPSRARIGSLLGKLTLLAAPVFAEHLLHVFVGWTDTYLANHLVWTSGLAGDELTRARDANAAATAAVGTISYVGWFIGLLVGAIGTGSTAIIARAVGAKHRALASGVCGQSITAAVVMGVVTGAILFVYAPQVAQISQLRGEAARYALDYLRLLSLAMPFTMLMFVAGACLRGAGDTLTPAIAMIVVDVVNIVASVGLTYGLWGFPRMGFHGIATGTAIAYVAGGVLLLGALIRGRGGIRLYLHRLRPHWTTMKRLLRIGLPGGVEGVLQWAANFGVLLVVNHLSNVVSAAHIITIRVESISYMAGFAAATAAATMVGQSLGMRDPLLARRYGYAGYLLGGSLMTLCGLSFILFGEQWARAFSADPQIVDLAGKCLFITGWIQPAFAAAMIFGASLRGAGDTLTVMLYNLASITFVRLVGVLLVTRVMGYGLPAIWAVLSFELCVRAALMYRRFVVGQWQEIRV
jgi:putative MATE family efflux protein